MAGKSELSAERKAYKAKFDAASKRHHCLRCRKKPVVGRFRAQQTTSKGVLPLVFWLCAGCSRDHAAFIGEVRAAEREAERPRREADRAARQAALDGTLAANRARLEKQREEAGLPPLPAQVTAKPKKRADRVAP